MNEITVGQNKRIIKRKRFTVEEDYKIQNLVKQFGENWDEIKKNFGPTREKRQLKERWQNYLNPNISPKFTEEENFLLYSLFIKIGPKWNDIAKKIGNKSASFCKNRIRAIKKNIEELYKTDERKTLKEYHSKINPNFKKIDVGKDIDIQIGMTFCENEFIETFDDTEDINEIDIFLIRL